MKTSLECHTLYERESIQQTSHRFKGVMSRFYRRFTRRSSSGVYVAKSSSKESMGQEMRNCAEFWTKVVIPTSLPRHVAICMDGNRRWAYKHRCTYDKAYTKAESAAGSIVESCQVLGISALTLFAFSSENWKRDSVQVSLVLKLMESFIERRWRTWKARNIRLKFIGNFELLPRSLCSLITLAEKETSGNDGLIVSIALSYSGRQDLVQCVKQLTKQASKGALRPEDITEALIGSKLQTFDAFGDVGKPDLFIRSGGEQRLSNFMLWDMAYTEFYFEKALWPDFGFKHFLTALQDYSQRDRRYGL